MQPTLQGGIRRTHSAQRPHWGPPTPHFLFHREDRSLGPRTFSSPPCSSAPPTYCAFLLRQELPFLPPVVWFPFGSFLSGRRHNRLSLFCYTVSPSSQLGSSPSAFPRAHDSSRRNKQTKTANQSKLSLILCLQHLSLSNLYLMVRMSSLPHPEGLPVVTFKPLQDGSIT